MELLFSASKKLYNARFLTLFELNRLLPLVNFSLWKRFYQWFLSLFRIFPKAKGFCIGLRQLSLKKSLVHMTVIAPTGAGKTTRVILGSLLANPTCSFVVTDPSGEIFDKTARYLQRKKRYDIQVLDFRKTEGVCSHAYNPIACTEDASELKAKCSQLYEAVYGGSGSSNNNDIFWKTMAESLLFCLTLFLKKQEKTYQNLSNLRHLVQVSASYPLDLLRLILKTRDLKLIKEYETFLASDEKVRRNIASTCLSCLDLLSDERVGHLTAHSTLDLARLRKKKSILYIITPEQDTRYYSPLTSLLFMDIFKLAMQPVQKGDMPLIILLDEAANTGVIQRGRFASLLATCRKRNTGICMILQSISQLENAVGKAESEIILGNTVSKMFLSGIDDPTAQMLSRKLGNTTVQYTGVDNVSVHETSRPLMTPDEIQVLPEDMGIFLHHNKRPALLKTIPAYQSKVLSRRMKTKAKIDLPLIPSGDIPLLEVPKSPPTKDG